MTKLVIFDIDGVVLDYLTGYCNFDNPKGLGPENKRLILEGQYNSSPGEYYFENVLSVEDHKILKEEIAVFNKTNDFGMLKPYCNIDHQTDLIEKAKRQSISYTYLTSCGTHPLTQYHRTYNLLGELYLVPFEQGIHIPLGADKRPYLLDLTKGYKKDDVIFFDDSLDNVRRAMSINITSVLVTHYHSKERTKELRDSGIKVAHNWDEIISFIE